MAYTKRQDKPYIPNSTQRDKSKSRIHFDHVVFMMSLAVQRSTINELTVNSEGETIIFGFGN